MEGNLSKALILKVLITQVFANLSPYVQYQTVQNRPVQSYTTSQQTQSNVGLSVKPTCSYNQGYQPYSTTNQYITATPKTTSAITAVVPTSQKTKTSKLGSKPGLDPKVLNNLAIALQLLIVSNMMNEDEDSEVLGNLLPDLKLDLPSYMYEALPSLSLQAKAKQSACPYAEAKYTATASSQDKSYYSKNRYETQPSSAPLPNASFLGSSGFEDTILQPPFGLPGVYGSSPSASPRSNTRSSKTLMSPYEALAPSTLFSDPMNPYDSGTGAFTDFQSPYASILANDPSSSMYSRAMELF